MDESYVSIFLKCYNCMKNPENAQVSGKNCNGQRNNKFNKTRKKKKKKKKSFVKIGPPVLEKKIFEGFLPYMGLAAILVM